MNIEDIVRTAISKLETYLQEKGCEILYTETIEHEHHSTLAFWLTSEFFISCPIQHLGVFYPEETIYNLYKITYTGHKDTWPHYSQYRYGELQLISNNMTLTDILII